jgi:hypothetical protein
MSRTRVIVLRAVATISIALTGAAQVEAADPALSYADLPRYRAALTGRPPSPEVRVGFHSLWQEPAAFRDRPIIVEGRVEKRYHQAATGEFPATTQLWIVEPQGNPFCTVFPAASQGDPSPGQTVRFVGTFLELIRYHGSGADRRAPLIVGPEPPSVIETKVAFDRPLDWAVGAVTGIFVALILLSRHMRRPRPHYPAIGPPPEFVSSEDVGATEPDGDDSGQNGVWKQGYVGE